ESSISRRKRKLGLKASHLTTLELNVTVKRQPIPHQMAKDPKGRLGIHLTRDYIREEMMKLDPAAHAARGPAHVKAKRQRKQLAAPDSLTPGSIELSEVHPNLSFIPIMDVGEDSDSSGIDSHINSSHAEILDRPNILPSNNSYPVPEADPHPAPRPFHAVTPSITVALGILRDIAPQMGALTRILDSLNIDEEVLDAQAHSLVAGVMDAAALLERQLARVASRTYRP
ncbi:hypothetical protein BYT27DRAFT_7198153, partial [Phlegmacium glaucopus]